LCATFDLLKPRARILYKNGGELGHDIRLLFTLQPAQPSEYFAVDRGLHSQGAPVGGWSQYPSLAQIHSSSSASNPLGCLEYVVSDRTDASQAGTIGKIAGYQDLMQGAARSLTHATDGA